jgi:hypothetical protein
MYIASTFRRKRSDLALVKNFLSGKSLEHTLEMEQDIFTREPSFLLHVLKEPILIWFHPARNTIAHIGKIVFSHIIRLLSESIVF